MHFSFKIWHLLATILMIFLKRINWLSFNLDTKTLRSCIHLLHHFNTMRYHLSTAEKRDIWSPGKAYSRDARDYKAKIRDVKRNTGRLATLRGARASAPDSWVRQCAAIYCWNMHVATSVLTRWHRSRRWLPSRRGIYSTIVSNCFSGLAGTTM